MKKGTKIVLVGACVVAFFVAIIFLVNFKLDWSCKQLAKKFGPTIISDSYVYQGECLLKARQSITDSQGASKVVETWISASKALGK